MLEGVRLGLFACLTLASFAGSLHAQGLDPKLVEEIRRGPAEIKLNEPIVSARIVGNQTLPLLTVAINGRGPFRMLIDFGSNVNLLRDSVARSSEAHMIVDRERNDIMRVREITIGKATFRDIVVGATDNLDVDGVLGFNFFRGLLVSIDFPRMNLELSWGRLPEPDGREILAFEVDQRMPFLPVMFGNERVLVNFDTGASGWLVMPSEFKGKLQFAVPLVPGPTMWNNQTGHTRVEIGRLAVDLQFGSYNVVLPRIEIDSGASFPFFGCSLLNRFSLTFDIPNRRVRIRGPKKPIHVPKFRTFGIRLSQIDETWRISDVIPNTRAADLGIQRGDLVLAINNIASRILTREMWNSIEKRRERISIKLSRTGRRTVYQLPLKELG